MRFYILAFMHTMNLAVVTLSAIVPFQAAFWLFDPATDQQGILVILVTLMPASVCLYLGSCVAAELEVWLGDTFSEYGESVPKD
jgi:hypothetical protein